jgi:hypothetical protein
MAGVKHATLETLDELGHTKTVLCDSGDVNVSITSERAVTKRYQAQSVTLQIVRGGIEVLNAPRGCYAWFEHCRLEARAGRKHLVLQLASGVVSSRGTAMTVVAASDSDALLREDPTNKQPVGLNKSKLQPKSKLP